MLFALLKSYTSFFLSRQLLHGASFVPFHAVFAFTAMPKVIKWADAVLPQPLETSLLL